MSTTSTVITIAICAVLVAAIGFALVKGIWSAAKKITVPIQIALFAVMLVCVCRLFCTKENARKLYDGIEQTGISQNVENTMRSALNLKPVEATSPGSKSARETVATETPEPVAATYLETAPISSSASVQKPDCTHLDKGKRSYTYALPFNAKVTVGFKDNTYRVIVESLGSLDASEKKEVGKLILSSLGKYVGKTIQNWDKSKISIESRYDEADGHTYVFVVVPPDAIE